VSSFAESGNGKSHMNKKEIAETLRTEVWHLEAETKKLQARCDRLKSFVSELEIEMNGPVVPPPKSILDGKFMDVVNTVFGEKPKRPKR
jgi:hypothetical protein